MLKNSNIIEKLNREEKATLIADADMLFTQGYAKSGIPRVAVSTVEEVNAGLSNLYPSFGAMSNSWNTDLISLVAQDIAVRAKNVNLLKTPPVRIKSNPYVEGLSEDPCVVRAYAYAILMGMREGGVMPCLYGITMTDADFKYVDIKMDFRTVRDYFLSPYKALSSFLGGATVITNLQKLEGSYSEVNTEALSNMLTTICERRGGYVICENVESDDTVRCAVKYTLAVGGNPSVFSQAITNYNYIRESINTGDASGNDLDSACREYTAVSGEAVDELCDKVINFARSCAGRTTAKAPSDDLILSSAEESIVLLKNTDGLLPLKSKCKIAIIGDPAFNGYTGENFAQFLTANGGFEVVGTARGYDTAEERSDNLLNEACNAVKGADAVLLFLSAKEEGRARTTTKLPANRIALVEAMTKLNKNVIAVVTSTGSIDMGFDTNVKAVLLAPLNSAGANEALTNIIRGVVSPSGKLAETYYAQTDAYFEKIKSEVRSGKRKVGGFIGYRYYDTAKVQVKYPFGYGLSYTQFSYTNMTLHGDNVDITVKNTGKYDGYEVVQLYVGKQNSSVVRPVKELKGFIKVFIKSGESKTIRFQLNTKLLAVYDNEKGKNAVEAGDYMLYACSSVNDVRKTVKMHILGENLTPDGKKMSDYVHSSSDVLEGGYMLGDVKFSQSRGKKLISCGIIAMIISLLGLGVLFALNHLSVIDIMAHKYLQIIFIAIMAIFALFTLLMIIGIIVYCCTKKKAVTVKAQQKSAPRPAHPFESLFEKQFKVEEEQVTVKEQTVETFDEEQEALRHIDISLTLNEACSQLVSYCASGGIKIDSSSAAKLLSALASSRLVVLRSQNTHLFTKLLKILNGYFGTDEYVESFSGVTNLEDFIEKTSRAVEDASKVRKDVHIAGLTNVNSDNLRDILLPLMKYIISPNVPCTVRYGYDNTLSLTPNIWYALALDGNARISGEDLIVLNSCAVIDLNISECAVKGAKAQCKHLSYYQLIKFALASAEQYPLDEDKCWKKVDKLEKYVNGHTPYHIGNKLWLRAERFASSIVSCGGEQAEALDATIASILLPSVICLLNGKISPEEEGLARVIENLLGEQNSEQCKKVLNAYGLIR